MKKSKIVQIGRVLAASAVALATVPSLASSNSVCGPHGCKMIADIHGAGTRAIAYNTHTDGTAAWHQITIHGDIDTQTISRIGGPGWQPIAGDFNQDGLDDLAVYKDGVFIVEWNLNGEFNGASTTYSLPGQPWNDNTIPMSGDWDGVGGDDFGIYTDGVFVLYPNRGDLTASTTVSFGHMPQIPGIVFTQMPFSGPIDNDPSGKAQVGVFFGNYLKYAPADQPGSYNFMNTASKALPAGTANRPVMFAGPTVADIDSSIGTNYAFVFLLPPGIAQPTSVCASTNYDCADFVPGTPQTQRPIVVPPDPFQ